MTQLQVVLYDINLPEISGVLWPIDSLYIVLRYQRRVDEFH